MNNIRVSIDLGNGYLTGIMFGTEDDRDIVLDKASKKTPGYRKGKILDADVLAENIHSMIEGFQNKIAGEYIDDVIVGISHPEMKIKRISEHRRILGNNTITNNDINQLSKLVKDISQENNHEIIKIIPSYRVLDDKKIEKKPVGSEANKLTLIADIFYLPRVFYQQLYDLFHSINLNVIDVVPNILSESEYLLNLDDKDLGSLLIDIGANQTGYAVVEDGNVLMYGSLPVGGDDVTKDLSIGLQINIKQAEKLKTDYEKIEKNEENMRLDHKFLHEIISARYEQIFTKINEELKKIDRDGKLAGGVHLTGQGTLWPETISYARDVFQLAVFPAQIDKSYHELSDNISFHAALSLYGRGKKYHDKQKGFFSRGFSRGGSGGGKKIWSNIVEFFKELF